MSDAHFRNLSQQGYKTAPVMRTILSDYDTPLSVYHKVAAQPQTYLLESVQGGDKWGRYSIIGLPCRKRLEVSGHQITLFDGHNGVEQQVSDDPLAWIEAYQARYQVFPQAGLPAFTGGLVGYFGYDTVRYVEERLRDSEPAQDDIQAPDIQLLVSEEIVVFDNLSGQVHVIVHADLSQDNAYSQAEARIEEIVAMINQPMPVPNDVPRDFIPEEADFQSSFGEGPFKDAVAKIKEYILSGDAMQIVISQQMRLITAPRRLICTAPCVI